MTRTNWLSSSLTAVTATTLSLCTGVECLRRSGATWVGHIPGVVPLNVGEGLVRRTETSSWSSRLLQVAIGGNWPLRFEPSAARLWRAELKWGVDFVLRLTATCHWHPTLCPPWFPTHVVPTSLMLAIRACSYGCGIAMLLHRLCFHKQACDKGVPAGLNQTVFAMCPGLPVN